jgi:hypothetical protein
MMSYMIFTGLTRSLFISFWVGIILLFLFIPRVDDNLRSEGESLLHYDLYSMSHLYNVCVGKALICELFLPIHFLVGKSELDRVFLSGARRVIDISVVYDAKTE